MNEPIEQKPDRPIGIGAPKKIKTENLFIPASRPLATRKESA
nr:MAG TPA: hypothetical protein [Caudoviricetes sp.]